MSKLWIVALLLGLTLSLAHEGHDHDHGHSDVLDLDDKTFDDVVAKNDLTFVEFFAPWCGHCQRLAPEYEEAAHQLAGKVVLAKVDCTQHNDLCSKHGVKGFPTLKLFRKDASEPIEYRSERSAEAMVKYLNKQQGPVVATLDSASLKALDEVADLAVAGFFTDLESAEAKEFAKTASALRDDYNFFQTTDADLIAQAGVTAPAVVVFKPFDEKKATFSGSIVSADLTTFINKQSLPLLGEIGPENYQKYLDRDLPLFWFFLNYEAENSKDIESAGRAVAADFNTKVIFVKLDGQRWAEHAKSLGLKSSTPGLVIMDPTKRKNYVFPEQDMTESNIRSFTQDFVDGKLNPNLRSQEPPAEQTGSVVTIVGKTFNDIVMDTTKDVFVEFYAPWCGHCKKLAPIYEKLGAEFASTPSVVIAQVDSTENDTPADVEGFPTLIFYPANDKANPINYDGERTLSALSKFVKQHASTLKSGDATEAEPAETKHDEL